MKLIKVKEILQMLVDGKLTLEDEMQFDDWELSKFLARKKPGHFLTNIQDSRDAMLDKEYYVLGDKNENID